VKDGIIR